MYGKQPSCVSLSLPSFLSEINKHILGWGLKKKKNGNNLSQCTPDVTITVVKFEGCCSLPVSALELLAVYIISLAFMMIGFRKANQDVG